MSKFCPILNRKVVYLDCLECDDKLCDKRDDAQQTEEEKSQEQNEEKETNEIC